MQGPSPNVNCKSSMNPLSSLELQPEPRGKSSDISITEADVTATAFAAT